MHRLRLKRHPEHHRQRHGFQRGPPVRQSQRQMFMGILGLCAIGPKQPVPPREVESEIAVSFFQADRVMDAVHVGGHDDPPQVLVTPIGHGDVAMMRGGGRIQPDFKDQHRFLSRAKQRDGDNCNAHRKQNLDEMGADAGSGIQIEIRMMHPVESPQHGGRCVATC